MPKTAMDNLTPSMFYVLMALSKEPLCGIDIASTVDRCTEGRLRLGPATLYTILGKFEKERYIEEISVEGRKRTYRITQKGGCMTTAVTRPTLPEIKVQCRIDHNYDDDYLSQLENSAFNLMNTYLNRTIITESNAELSDNEIMYNDQLKIAELMIIDSFYNDRSAEKIPGAAIFILNQFRIAQA